MTSSLVGSEMCIRDSCCSVDRDVLDKKKGQKDPDTENPVTMWYNNMKPVSYTHLTLPTICSV
eukprot:4159127-Prorocentrum_lima.AAC.1